MKSSLPFVPVYKEKNKVIVVNFVGERHSGGAADGGNEGYSRTIPRQFCHSNRTTVMVRLPRVPRASPEVKKTKSFRCCVQQSLAITRFSYCGLAVL